MKAAENAVILWQGWLDLNQRMRESKSLALPLGYTPIREKKGDRDSIPDPALFVGWVKGLEPSTPGTTIRCSNQLSYTHHISGITREASPQAALGEMVRQKGFEPPAYCLEGSCSILLSYWRKWMEQVTGIEPASPAWKAGALAIVLHPHAPSAKSSALSYYHILLGSVKRKIEIFRPQKIPGKILEHLLQTRIFCDIIEKSTR